MISLRASSHPPLQDSLSRYEQACINRGAHTVPIQCPNSAHTVPIVKTHSAHISTHSKIKALPPSLPQKVKIWALCVFPMGTVWALYGHCLGTVWALCVARVCLACTHHAAHHTHVWGDDVCTRTAARNVAISVGTRLAIISMMSGVAAFDFSCCSFIIHCISSLCSGFWTCTCHGCIQWAPQASASTDAPAATANTTRTS